MTVDTLLAGVKDRLQHPSLPARADRRRVDDLDLSDFDFAGTAPDVPPSGKPEDTAMIGGGPPGAAPEEPPSADGEGQRHEQAGGPPGAAVTVDLLRSIFNEPVLLKADPPGARWIAGSLPVPAMVA